MKHGDEKVSRVLRATASRRGAGERRAALAALLTSMLAAGPAFAEDVVPKALPDRIDDVPATRPDPFPAFDNFSWRAFIALNWPSRLELNHRGEPDRSKSLAAPGPRVWETFKARYEVFLRDADGRPAPPPPWASYAGRNPCGPEVDNRTKTLNSFSLYSDFNQAAFELGKFEGPLVAQNRTYTRYEVRFNRPEFRSIVDHKWFLRSQMPTVEHPARFETGAIAVKAAWRILTDRDTPAIRSRYYVVSNARVLDVAKTREAGRPVCAVQDIALVGFHMAIKTLYRPQWIWSSFEHIDNVPPAGDGDAREPDARAAGVPYSYFDPSRPSGDGKQTIGPPPPPPVAVSDPPSIDPEPIQVTRVHHINARTMEMNRAYWSLQQIKGTVWGNYMLVLTQWPTATQPEAPQNDGRYFPGVNPEPNTPVEVYQLPGGVDDPGQNLANTTMETYLQDRSYSCMACHHALSNAIGRDFVTFMELDAN